MGTKTTRRAPPPHFPRSFDRRPCFEAGLTSCCRFSSSAANAASCCSRGVSSSHMTMPNENTSAFSSYGRCSITSGAIQRYVPVSAVMTPLASMTRATPGEGEPISALLTPAPHGL
ncbi:hypothetical protein TSOC_008068 [Tetrabaena socialis]|uniref:Uncharacterized protein n=1 Tax=Tetrabaena socialis TaxID=47790 RepID=A0A2J7ZZH6_9CHLO|nr:hypothetical protein TSOC_008068 [Tetrabaena socialis]|eukprot:PNH05663.1 hypothetical protein TSOC_008068 [Tetrabaena socialis]